MRSQKPKERASCPFCHHKIPRPAPVFETKHTSFDGGSCTCGAVYLVDSTGRNMGEVLLNAMSILGIADKMHEVSFEEKIFLYEKVDHTLIKKKKSVRYKGQKILFLRLNSNSSSPEK